MIQSNDLTIASYKCPSFRVHTAFIDTVGTYETALYVVGPDAEWNIINNTDTTVYQATATFFQVVRGLLRLGNENYCWKYMEYGPMYQKRIVAESGHKAVVSAPPAVKWLYGRSSIKCEV